jgi:hypothetical protein
MAAGFILITETADITSDYFVHEVFGNPCVNCGAAQNINLFLHTRPPLSELVKYNDKVGSD